MVKSITQYVDVCLCTVHCNAAAALDNNLKTNQFRLLHCVLPNAFIITASFCVPFMIWTDTASMRADISSSVEKGKSRRKKPPTATKDETQKSFILLQCRFVCYKLLFGRSFEIIICNHFDLSQHNLPAATETFMVKYISILDLCGSFSRSLTFSQSALETNFKSELWFLSSTRTTDCSAMEEIEQVVSRSDVKQPSFAQIFSDCIVCGSCHQT